MDRKKGRLHPCLDEFGPGGADPLRASAGVAFERLRPQTKLSELNPKNERWSSPAARGSWRWSREPSDRGISLPLRIHNPFQRQPPPAKDWTEPVPTGAPLALHRARDKRAASKRRIGTRRTSALQVLRMKSAELPKASPTQPTDLNGRARRGVGRSHS